jgi:hypothetical protein
MKWQMVEVAIQSGLAGLAVGVMLSCLLFDLIVNRNKD